jgi:dihydrofolate reductase
MPELADSDANVSEHHARSPLEMEGRTVFHFVTDGIQSALDRARGAANGRDIRIGGGASTIRQYLNARLIDEMHLGLSDNC